MDFVVTESEKYNCFYGGLVTRFRFKSSKEIFSNFISSRVAFKMML